MPSQLYQQVLAQLRVKLANVAPVMASSLYIRKSRLEHIIEILLKDGSAPVLRLN